MQLDNDCDGAVNENEDTCDNEDNDGDGLPDDGPASCLARFLVVPFCWKPEPDPNDPLSGIDPLIWQDFPEAAEYEINKFLSDSGVQVCAAKKFITKLGPDPYGGGCPGIWEDSDEDDCHEAFADLIDHIQVTSPEPLSTLDHIIAITNSGFCGNTGGTSNTGAQVVWIEHRDNVNAPGYSDHLGIFSHEMGHQLGLSDEYCSRLYSDDTRCASGGPEPAAAPFDGEPNWLTPTLGCSPYNGDGCCDGCENDYYYCCEGNQNSQGGRCTMSSSSAEEPHAYCDMCKSWVGNPTDTMWSPGVRGRQFLVGQQPGERPSWSELPLWGPGTDVATLARGQVPMDCNFEHQGTFPVQKLTYLQRRDGSIQVKHHEVYTGRIGLAALPAQGSYGLELLDPSGQVSYAVIADDIRFGGEVFVHEGPPSAEADIAVVNIRLPVPASVTGTDKLKLRSFNDGVLVSETTLNGEAPTADAGEDRPIECQANGEATVALDGLASSDPDAGDKLRYTWTVEGLELPQHNATPLVVLPLGPTQISLTVSDGIFESSPDTQDLLVRDSIDPVAQCTGPTVQCVGNLTPVTTTCTASDACDPEVGTTSTALPSYPLGTHSFTCTATDLSNNLDQATCQVHVVDTTPPTLVLSPNTNLLVCHEDAQIVTLPFPTVTDSCGQGTPTVAGSLIAVNGKTLPMPVAVPANGILTLQAGTALVRWQASDTNNNQASADQLFTINVQETTACCPAGMTVVQGTSAADYLYRSAGTNCVLGYNGDDFVNTAAGNDLLIGGAGADQVTGGGGQDVLYTGAGADGVNCGYGGNYVAHAGAGDDNVQAVYCSTAQIWGGNGADYLYGSPGVDLIVPGPGRDTVLASGGNDTVRLYHVCEAMSGKTLDGGSGGDTLYIPVPVSQLQALGVAVTSFENVVVDSSQGYLSPCF